MPRLTVIMPAFNAAPTIARAVRSTLIDLPRDSELHVVDDASTDDTLDILLQIAAQDPRVTVKANPVNIGVARSLNRLLRESDSRYVARMDADDLVIPGRFRRVLSVLDSGNTDVLFGGLVHLGPGRRVRPAVQIPISTEAMPLFLLLGNPVAHSTMAARREALDVGYREVPSEDYDLWLRLAGAGLRLRRIVQPSVLYRHHPEQITAQPAWKAAAAINASTAAVHADNSYLALGVRFEVYSALRGTAAVAPRELSLFLATASEAAERLSGLERADFRRRCRKLLLNRTAQEISHA